MSKKVRVLISIADGELRVLSDTENVSFMVYNSDDGSHRYNTAELSPDEVRGEFKDYEEPHEETE